MTDKQEILEKVESLQKDVSELRQEVSLLTGLYERQYPEEFLSADSAEENNDD